MSELGSLTNTKVIRTTAIESRLRAPGGLANLPGGKSAGDSIPETREPLDARFATLIGTKPQYPTKAAAWKEVGRLWLDKPKIESGETVRDVIVRYELERMPTRPSTAYVYRSFLKNHIIPRWSDTPIAAVCARDAELWLQSLNLSPKSKTHVRSLLHSLVEFAMWAGILTTGRNPISLV
jgi:hypothetical protein